MFNASAIFWSVSNTSQKSWTWKVQLRSSPGGQVVAKPLASTGFLGVAWVAGALGSTYGMVVLLALVLCWLGDVLLLWRALTALEGRLDEPVVLDFDGRNYAVARIADRKIGDRSAAQPDLAEALERGGPFYLAGTDLAELKLGGRWRDRGRAILVPSRVDRDLADGEGLISFSRPNTFIKAYLLRAPDGCSLLF